MTDAPKPPVPSPWEEIQRFADEVRVKVHLAGMELKDKWKKLEPEVQAVERDLAAAGAVIEGALSRQLDALAVNLRKLAADLRDDGKKKPS